MAGKFKGTYRAYYEGTHTKTPTYTTWAGLAQRCYNPNSRAYRWYGAKGVIVCDRWRHSFHNFVTDMGERPGPEYSLDRINSKGNYEPENCRWVTWDIQTANKVYNGRISRSHCLRGHEFNEGNTGWGTKGKFCKTCNRDGANARRRGLSIEAYLKIKPSDITNEQGKCRRGHEWTEENTYWYFKDSLRTRMCRACSNRRAKETRRRANGST